MPRTYHLILASTFEESERVPDFVEEIQNEAGLSDKITGNFMLLLSEAVSNAIDHGNKNDPSKKVEIEIQITGKEIKASVHDEGEGFNPDNTKNPVMEENLLDPSGRGIFILKELADSVEFEDNGRKLIFAMNRE